MVATATSRTNVENGRDGGSTEKGQRRRSAENAAAERNNERGQRRRTRTEDEEKVRTPVKLDNHCAVQAVNRMHGV